MVEEEHADGQKVQNTCKATSCEYKSRELSFTANPEFKEQGCCLWVLPRVALLVRAVGGGDTTHTVCRLASPLAEGCDRGPKTLCGAPPGLGIAGPTGARATQRAERGKNMGWTPLKHWLLAVLSPSPILAPSLKALMATVMTQSGV